MNDNLINDISYKLALKKNYDLMQQNPEKESSSGQELEMLVTLVEAFETIHYPMPVSEPIDIIKSIMKEKKLTQKDLIPYIGNISRVSKILNGKSELTTSMIRKISKGFNIPADRLI